MDQIILKRVMISLNAVLIGAAVASLIYFRFFQVVYPKVEISNFLNFGLWIMPVLGVVVMLNTIYEFNRRGCSERCLIGIVFYMIACCTLTFPAANAIWMIL